MISEIIISYRGVSVSSLRVEIASATYYAAVVGDRGWGLVGSAGSCGVRRELFMLFPPSPYSSGWQHLCSTLLVSLPDVSSSGRCV